MGIVKDTPESPPQEEKPQQSWGQKPQKAKIHESGPGQAVWKLIYVFCVVPCVPACQHPGLHAFCPGRKN